LDKVGASFIASEIKTSRIINIACHVLVDIIKAPHQAVNKSIEVRGIIELLIKRSAYYSLAIKIKNTKVIAIACGLRSVHINKDISWRPAHENKIIHPAC
jgi:hypothetical protein